MLPGFFVWKSERAHFNDSLWLRTLFNHVDCSAAISLIVTDIVGHLSGFEVLVSIAVAARPVVDILSSGEAKRKKIKILKKKKFWQHITRPETFHISVRHFVVFKS